MWSCEPDSEERISRQRPVVLLLVGLMSLGCGVRHSPPLFGTKFGVGIGDAPLTAAQLGQLGPVWYMDWSWSKPPVPGHERLYVINCDEVQSQGSRIAAAMKASGPSWWALGNEPNDPNQDNRTPEEYAVLYRTFEDWAAEAPQCGILPAGIANADWQWAQQFRQSFLDQFGRYPRVDGWNIHNYILEPGLDPYDVGEFSRRIDAFDKWMESIGDGDKPLFLTEFGVLYGSGCCDRPVDPPERLQQFMLGTVDWLKSSGKVQAWAWFATYSRRYNGSLMSPDGELNELGELYGQLVRQDSQ